MTTPPTRAAFPGLGSCCQYIGRSLPPTGSPVEIAIETNQDCRVLFGGEVLVSIVEIEPVLVDRHSKRGISSGVMEASLTPPSMSTS